jgi:hypothetical protein
MTAMASPNVVARLICYCCRYQKETIDANRYRWQWFKVLTWVFSLGQCAVSSRYEGGV